MQFKKISPKVSVSPQIAVKDIAAIRAAGYRAIICNRPDGEGDICYYDSTDHSSG